MLGEWLDDIEQDALATAVQEATAYLDKQQTLFGEEQWARELAKYQQDGRERIESGAALRAARKLEISARMGSELAALARLHGGVRIGGVVFCATHYPAGRESRSRFACDFCDPDARYGVIGRNVITFGRSEIL